MPSDEKRDDEVGYGRPLRHTRFKKGQSGNPKGRPGSAKNLSTLLCEALNERVIIAENGGRREISKRQAVIKQIVNQSAKGDWRTAKLLFDIPAGHRKSDRTGNLGELVWLGGREGHRAAEGAAARQKIR
jgi:hypothetical protein